jgi:predicted dehydrogenase
MMMKAGIIGLGYVGASHIEGVRRLGWVEVAAVADANHMLAQQRAQQYGVPRYYASIDELIADPDIQVIHNCTPNHLHLEVNRKIIEAGKHVFSEKPLARNVEESALTLEILSKYPEVTAGVNYCYRMNPLVQDAKERIAQGEIGRPLLVHGSYLQDWLLFPTDYNWRVEQEYAGESRCVADIGTHWLDLAQVMTASRITEVCANAVTAHPVRQKPAAAVESFSRHAGVSCEDVAVDTEDYAGALLRFENGAAGVFQCSEISAGRKCFIDIEVNGSLSSYQWQHETGDRMWKGNRDANNEEILRNPNLMTSHARQYTYLSAGHPEGWNDAFKSTLAAYYSFVRDRKSTMLEKPDFATFEDAHYLMLLTRAILQSAREERWVRVDGRTARLDAMDGPHGKK